ncbi:MAG: T9SS type A sorting domain-containing protein [Cyclobacteriaceae bacterium]
MRVLYLLFLFILGLNQAQATHVIGGTISLKQLSGLTYEISLHYWQNTGSSVQFGGGQMTINGKQVLVQLEDDPAFRESIEIGQGTAYAELTLNYTFEAPGTYDITYQEFNRDAGIINMSNSVDTPFAIKTQLLIDPLFGSNQTPGPTAYPVPGVGPAVDFHFNPGFTDADGDSISYHLAVPVSSDSTEVTDYRFPGYFGGAFGLNPLTGEVAWTGARLSGKYVYAMVVREWRRVAGQLVKLSESSFDIMLFVDEHYNDRQTQIEFEEGVCADEGQVVNISSSYQNLTLTLTSDYSGKILIDGERLAAIGLIRSFDNDLRLEVDFDLTHPDADMVNELSFTIRDTSDFALAHRTLIFSANCDQLSSSIVTSVEKPAHAFQVFPNPTSDYVNIDISDMRGKQMTLQILSTAGEEVYWDQIIAEEKNLLFTLNDLPKGIYLMRIICDKKQYTQRIVLQ